MVIGLILGGIKELERLCLRYGIRCSYPGLYIHVIHIWWLNRITMFLLLRVLNSLLSLRILELKLGHYVLILLTSYVVSLYIVVLDWVFIKHIFFLIILPFFNWLESLIRKLSLACLEVKRFIALIIWNQEISVSLLRFIIQFHVSRLGARSIGVYILKNVVYLINRIWQSSLAV